MMGSDRWLGRSSHALPISSHTPLHHEVEGALLGYVRCTFSREQIYWRDVDTWACGTTGVWLWIFHSCSSVVSSQMQMADSFPPSKRTATRHRGLNKLWYEQDVIVSTLGGSN